MKPAIVSDTSPPNYLVLTETVELLPRLFSQVIIPPAVALLKQSPAWLQRRTPQRSSAIGRLDPGESEAIALAHKLGISELLLDDGAARLVAIGQGLTVFGTLGILEAGSRRGWIDFDECVQRLRATNCRVHERLIAEARLRIKATPS